MTTIPRRTLRAVWGNLAVLVLAALVGVVVYFYLAIQHSRLASCKQQYEGTRQLFKPFFPRPPRTHKQQADLDKFNNRVDELKARCSKQIATKGVAP